MKEAYIGKVDADQPEADFCNKVKVDQSRGKGNGQIAPIPRKVTRTLAR